jgi:hypothetical protein
MSRMVTSFESQAAQLAGNPSGVTFNGYFAAIVAGATCNYKLRRLIIGVRGPAGSVTSDQHTIVLYRQTVRASGTGLSTQTFAPTDQRATPSLVTGVDFTTAAAAGTTGPTVTTASPLPRLTFNTQGYQDVPFEFPDDMYICDQGTANGIALVNIGNALPASHLFAVTAEIDE